MTNPPDALASTLHHTLEASSASGVGLTLAGGYGLLLRQTHAVPDERYLVDQVEWPPIRPTRDIDIFVLPAAVADWDRMQRFASELDSRGFSRPPHDAAENFRVPHRATGVMLDLLMGPAGEYRTRIRINDARRSARPQAPPNTTTDTALRLSLAPEALDVDRSVLLHTDSGQQVPVASTFTWTMMMLHVIGDVLAGSKASYREDREAHLAKRSVDLFRNIAMLTRVEEDAFSEACSRHRDDPAFSTAAALACAHVLPLDGLARRSFLSSRIGSAAIDRVAGVLEDHLCT
ncbi:MAG: hypothetical protein AB7K09_12155 [Planctomycetota bacterium]